MKLTNKIRAQAEATIVVTLDQAKALPGMLGRIVPGMLAFHGFYTCNLDGKRTLYLAEGPEFAELKRRAESLVK